jgi:uncharacterized protein VirK/YbjX
MQDAFALKEKILQFYVKSILSLKLTIGKNKTLKKGVIRVIYFFQINKFYKKFSTSKFSLLIDGVTLDEKKLIKQKIFGGYLTPFTNLAQRIKLNSSFYDFLNMNFNDEFFMELNKGVLIWKMDCNGNFHNIVLSLPYMTKTEGDLSLQYWFNNDVLHSLTFSFIDGRLMKVKDKKLVFIAGSQGCRSSSPLVRDASKQNHEISPRAALVVALKAISKSLDIKKIAGIKSEYQVHLHNDVDLKKCHSYDELWIKNYGIDAGLFYVMPINVSPDASEPISGNHASRTRRKRKNREDLFNVIQLGFDKFVSNQIKSNQIKSSQVKSSQVKSSQVKSGQTILNCSKLNISN